MFVWAFCARLGLLPMDPGITSHTVLAGLLHLASAWHWVFWDLDAFATESTLALDLLRVFGIHLVLASAPCFLFGHSHLTASAGPGFWTTDAFGLVGRARGLKPSFSIPALSPYSFGSLAAHHLLAGCLGCFAGFWHIGARPSPLLAAAFGASSAETALASSLSPVLLAATIASATAWYGASSCANQLFGPARFGWDSAVFCQELASRAGSAGSLRATAVSFWQSSPDQLLLSDYAGSDPAKGGLFRSGPALKSDGLAQNWLGRVDFLGPGGTGLVVRRLPAFFETFPVLLVDEAGEVRADVAFRRADARFSIEARRISASLGGGILGKQSFQRASLVKCLARKAQLGQIFTFASPSALLTVDGVFRTSIRGWFTLAHSLFTFLPLLGHIWHATRSLFRDLWLGVLRSSSDAVEYGKCEQLG